MNTTALEPRSEHTPIPGGSRVNAVAAEPLSAHARYRRWLA